MNRWSTPPPTTAGRSTSPERRAKSTNDRVSPPTRAGIVATVIYCVVPEPLAPELYERLASYYQEDPNVTVIVDRRKSERRDPGAGGGGMREVRDRRRPRGGGEFPPIPGD